MKKAWELSVLCSADVSIVIFAPSGKCFEFTSVQDGKGLDGQVARYVDVGIATSDALMAV